MPEGETNEDDIYEVLIAIDDEKAGYTEVMNDLRKAILKYVMDRVPTGEQQGELSRLHLELERNWQLGLTRHHAR